MIANQVPLPFAVTLLPDEERKGLLPFSDVFLHPKEQQAGTKRLRRSDPKCCSRTWQSTKLLLMVTLNKGDSRDRTSVR